MLNKRLLQFSKKTMTHVWLSVASQNFALLATVFLIQQVASHFQEIALQKDLNYLGILVIFFLVMILRSKVKRIVAKQGAMAGAEVKSKLRCEIYEKILRLGGSYTSHFSTAELVQISSEGVEQLELYFANYLPQFFYCMIAPLLLFGLLWEKSFWAAFVLFLCVPLIPISIIIVQKIAKKLLGKYWALYANLGDSFLENVQGLTTLKIYGADQHYHKKMNESAENFRKITMKVLSMQLNSIIIMDLVAYGGASLGSIVALTEFEKGVISLADCATIILLAAEFFLPMRLMGSYFHIAMNGMAAWEKISKVLDIPKVEDGKEWLGNREAVLSLEGVSFSYQNGNNDKEILKDITFTAKTGLTALVGVSGSGKSTIASLLCRNHSPSQGTITLTHIPLKDFQLASLRHEICKVTHNPYLFTGTVAENLAMAKANATEEEMITVLKQGKIWDFFQSQEGLDTVIQERGSNLSGGEKQRLNLARSLLKDCKIYIFDEVTSNIDVESEEAIMNVILDLAKTKTVLLISHRLQNVQQADQILFLKQGKILESGKHQELLANKSAYAQLFETQSALEKIRKGGA